MDVESGEIVAYTDHFSSGFFGVVDFDPLGWLSRSVRGRSDVEEPACSGDSLATGTVVQNQNSGDSIRWCAGNDSDSTYLLVANNRNTYSAIEFPKGWNLQSQTPRSFRLSEGAERTAGDFFATTDLEGSENESADFAVISPADTIELRIPDGSQGWVVTDYRFSAWLADFVISAVEILVPATAATDLVPWEELALCISLKVPDSTAISDGTTFVQEAARAGLGCLGDIAAVIAKNAGEQKGGVAGALVEQAVRIALIAASAVPLLGNTLRGAYDELASLYGTDDPRRIIAVGQLSPLELTASTDTCPLSVWCDYGFEVFGATPNSTVRLSIVNGAGTDIQVLPDFWYTEKWQSDSSGYVSMPDFSTNLWEPDTHTFVVEDEATGRSVSAEVRFTNETNLSLTPGTDCTTQTLMTAWNNRYGGDFPLDLGPYEGQDPRCNAGVAVLFVSQTRDDLGNPDFGVAVLVVDGDSWRPVTRYRTPFCEQTSTDLRSEGLSRIQVEAATTLMELGEC